MTDNAANAGYPAGLDRRTLVSWRNAVFAIFGLAGFGMASWLSRLPTVRDSLHASSGQMGLLALSIAIGSILGLAAAGPLVTRLGPRRSMALSIAATVVALVAAALGATLAAYPLTMAGLALFGLGTGACDVAMNVSGAANERGLGRSVMPLFHAVFSLGTVIGVGVGALAETVHVPVVVHVGGAVVVMIVLAVLALPRIHVEREEDHDEDAGAAPTGRRRAWAERLASWRDPRILMVGVVVMGMALSEGSANDWLPLAMVDGHGVPNATASAILAVFLAAMTTGRIVGTPLLDRFGRVPVLRFCAALAAVGLLVLVVVPNLAVALVGAVLWGLGTSLGFPVGISAAADDPKRAAANVSTASAIGYVAFLGGPPVIGFLAEHVGTLHALLLVLVVIVVAGLAAGAARKPDAVR